MLHGDALLRALRTIGRNDPDGGETEPTDAAYAAHERWAIDTFGREVWERYIRHDWADLGASDIV